VRRFLLYNVLFHEIGHLQLVRPKSRRWKRKFASETLAQLFADNLRGRLWSESFDHGDPVHNPPAEDELAFLPAWRALDKDGRYRLVVLALSAPHRYEMLPSFDFLGDLDPIQEDFITRALCHAKLTI
jgi:hypothetical protein